MYCDICESSNIEYSSDRMEHITLEEYTRCNECGYTYQFVTGTEEEFLGPFTIRSHYSNGYKGTVYLGEVDFEGIYIKVPVRASLVHRLFTMLVTIRLPLRDYEKFLEKGLEEWE